MRKRLSKVPREWDGGANSVRVPFRVLRIQDEVRVGKGFSGLVAKCFLELIR